MNELETVDMHEQASESVSEPVSEAGMKRGTHPFVFLLAHPPSSCLHSLPSPPSPPASLEWRQLDLQPPAPGLSPPAPRCAHTAVLVERRMLVLGGRGGAPTAGVREEGGSKGEEEGAEIFRGLT